MPARNAHDGGEHQYQAHHHSRKEHREHSVQDDEIVVIRQLREAVVETGGEEEHQNLELKVKGGPGGWLVLLVNRT